MDNDHAPGTASAAAERVADDMRSEAEATKTRAADTAQHAADSARHAADCLRGEETWLAGLVEQGADRLAEFAQSVRQSDMNTLLARTEDFARRQPVLFTGAAMALGFALTRAVTAAAGKTDTSSQEMHDVC